MKEVHSIRLSDGELLLLDGLVEAAVDSDDYPAAQPDGYRHSLRLYVGRDKVRGNDAVVVEIEMYGPGGADKSITRLSGNATLADVEEVVDKYDPCARLPIVGGGSLDVVSRSQLVERYTRRAMRFKKEAKKTARPVPRSQNEE